MKKDVGKKKYLLNINSKKFHLSSSSDGRCKIKEMREENKLYFNTQQEVMEYPSNKNALAKKCMFCLKYFKEK